jgi:hypothetical protein
MSSVQKLVLMACGGVASLSIAPAPAHAFGPVATRAVCGPGDRTESGLQGQTTLAERFSSDQMRAYNCNLELLGQYVGEGAGAGLGIIDKCAYVAQWLVPLPLVSVLKNPGVMVVDVSDPTKPKAAKYLRTPGMIQPAESLSLDLNRKLLIGQHLNKNGEYGSTLDIYDVSDCLNPKLQFSGVIPGYIFHGGDFSPDGTILWGTTGPVLRAEEPEVGDTIAALDISDPTKPQVIATYRAEDPVKIQRFHGISVADDGNTAFYTIGEHEYERVNGKIVPSPHQGIGTLDVSEVQARKPNARIKPVGEPVFWDDIVHNQFLRPMTIKGRKYLWENRLDGVIASDAKLHTGVKFKRPVDSPEEACLAGKAAWGFVSIFDIEDALHPKRVSAVKLEVHEPKNCLATAYDPVYSHGYSPLICDVDNYQDARMMVCAFTEGGIRVFDIRDIKRPREIAYYKPAAVGSAPRAASPYQPFRDVAGTVSKATRFHSADGTTHSFFANGAKEIWFTSFDGGFHVVRFSDGLLKKEKDLFDGIRTCVGGLRPAHGCPGEQ